jgi:hypothetical protein
MPDPATQKLSEVEKALELVATPKGPDLRNGTAEPVNPLLDSITFLLRVLYGAGGLGQAASGVGREIHNGLKQAVDALRAIGDHLKTIVGTAADVGTTLAALKGALDATQTLVPGSPAALSSGSQFFGMLGDLVAETGDVGKAADTLFELAQQIDLVAERLQPPA